MDNHQNLAFYGGPHHKSAYKLPINGVFSPKKCIDGAIFQKRGFTVVSTVKVIVAYTVGKHRSTSPLSCYISLNNSFYGGPHRKSACKSLIFSADRRFMVASTIKRL
jgi:hypothetical protein